MVEGFFLKAFKQKKNNPQYSLFGLKSFAKPAWLRKTTALGALQ